MNKLFFLFVFSFILLTACSVLEWDSETQHAVIENDEYRCEFVRGVRVNCVKLEKDIKNGVSQ